MIVKNLTLALGLITLSACGSGTGPAEPTDTFEDAPLDFFDNPDDDGSAGDAGETTWAADNLAHDAGEMSYTDNSDGGNGDSANDDHSGVPDSGYSDNGYGDNGYGSGYGGSSGTDDGYGSGYDSGYSDSSGTDDGYGSGYDSGYGG